MYYLVRNSEVLRVANQFEGSSFGDLFYSVKSNHFF